MNTSVSFQPILDHPLVSQLRQAAQVQGVTLYAVGGVVRDWLLEGRLSGDLDVAVLGGSSEPLARAMANALQGHYVLLDETFGIHRVVLDPAFHGVHTLDVSEALNQNLQQDLARRDLTINAMALDLQAGALLDPLGGQADLEKRCIRMVCEPNLVEDPLRLLRVFRMAAQIQANCFDPETLHAVQQHREKLLNAAWERIHYEFLRMLSVEPCFPFLQTMAETGLLEVILPELKDTRTVPPNAHHHLWLFEHTLELVNQAELLLPQLPTKSRERLGRAFNPFTTHLALVKLACLLHDIGKPATMAQSETGRTTFYGHDAVSEEMTQSLCSRWKVSSELCHLVKKLVRWHLYPCQFGPDSSRKSVLRFFRRMGAETPEVVLLALADRFSTRGPAILEADLAKSRHDHLWLLEQYEAEQETLQLPRLLSGHEVMRILGISPGPHVGKILEALEEAHQLGEINSAEQASDWLQTHRAELLG